MAWDPATFPWDLDAESFHVGSHGSGNELRKLTSTGNGRLLETELCVGKNGVSFHFSKELGPMVPATGTSSPAKHDASTIGCCHASRHMNGFSRESGSPMPMTCPASLPSQDDSNVSWHGTLHMTGSGMAHTHSVLPSNGVDGRSEVSSTNYGVLPIVTTCIASGLGCITSSNNDTAVHSPGTSVHKVVMNNGKKMEYGIAGVFEQDRLQQQPWLMQQAHQQMSLSKEEIHLAPMKVKEESNMASTSSVKAHPNDEQHSSNATGSAGSGDSFTGLHLGKRTYMPDVVKATSSKAAQKPVLAPKKARTGVAIPRCQVEGCKLDLTSAKDYHRKHKVCEVHAKAGKAMVASSEQRFCQQCSRFHALGEFDEAKRSCRRRLAGHNERRRKPQPDPLGLHRLHSAYEDWSFLHQPRFSRMPILWQEAGDYRSGGIWPCTTTPSFDTHPSCDYTIQGPAMERQGYMKSLSQSPLSYNNKLSLLLLQSPKSVMPNSAGYPRVHHYPFEVLGGPLGDTLTLAPSSAGVGVLQGLDTTPVTRGVTRVSDSGRALSLLSLQSRGSHAPDILMPDPPGLANMLSLNHQLVHNDGGIVPQQFPFQGGQQYHYDVSVDKNLISMALSSSHAQFDGGHMGSMVDECAFTHDLDRQASTHPLFALMPYPQADELSQQGGLHHEGATV